MLSSLKAKLLSLGYLKLSALIIVGFLVLVAGIIGLLSYKDSVTSVKDLQITNVTDSAFSVVWSSDSPYIAGIVYEKNDNNKQWPVLFGQLGKHIIYDDRDVEQDQNGNYIQVETGAKPRYTHHVTVRDLAPDTDYKFRIAGSINGKDPELSTVRTKALIESLSTPDPAYGKVSNAVVDDGIIIVSTTTTSISTVLSDQSTYTFDIGLFPTGTKASSLDVQIYNKNNQIIKAKFTKNDYKPLEDLLLPITTSSSGLVKSIAAAAFCTPGTYKAGNNIVVRSGPGTNYSKVDSLTMNTEVNVISCPNNSWAMIGENRYVAVSYLSLVSASNTPQPTVQPTNAPTPQPTVVPTQSAQGGQTCISTISPSNNSNLNLREGPSVDSRKLTTIPYNGQMCLLSVEGDWGKVIYNDQTGYVFLKYTTAASTTPPPSNPQQPATPTAAPAPPAIPQEPNAPVDPSPISMSNSQINSMYVDKKCNSASECGGRGLVCQCPDPNDVYVPGIDPNTGDFRPTIFKCDASEYICADRQTEGFSYINSDYRPPLQKWDVPAGYDDIVMIDNFYTLGFGRDGGHPDLIDGLQRAVTGCLRGSLPAGQKMLISQAYVNPYGASTYNQHSTGRAVDLYLVRNDKPLSDTVGNPLLSVAPIRGCLEASGFVKPRQMEETGDVPHYIVPSSVNIPGAPVSAQSPNDMSLIRRSQAESTGITVQEGGKFKLTSSSYQFANTEVEISLGEGDVANIHIFDDKNSNGIKDKGEVDITSQASLSVSKIESAFEYKMNVGWNLVTFPFISTENITKASELFDNFQKRGLQVVHIARFKDGKFEMYTRRENEQAFTNDYEILPNVGYFIFTRNSAVITLTGNGLNAAAPIQLNNGWNLVGVYYDPNKLYTSEELLNEIQKQGITADTISSHDSGIYNSVIVDNATVYGNNFRISRLKGYFIRVDSGGGKSFTP
jgi:uncharacterized protein YgiM (DUF1202 family)